MEELKLNIHSINADGNEVVIRTGEALPVREPEKLVLSGNIDSVSRYIKQRGTKRQKGAETSINAEHAIIVVNRDKLTISLFCNPENVFAAEISGKMEMNPDLLRFSINGDKKFTREELVSLLKLNRFFFADKDEHAVLFSKVKNFKANVNKDVEDGSDNRGNKNRVNNQTLNTDVPEQFVLKIPVFKGEDPSTFIVEICLDVTDGGSRFWLESLDLNELILKKRDEVFEKELNNFDGFCVIEQ